MSTRREFLAGTALAAAASSAAGPLLAELATSSRKAPFKLSLAEWSFHKALQSKQMDNRDFAQAARGLELDAIEYVNTFFKDKAKDAAYLAELNRRAQEHGIFQHLIMCDGEGKLGDPDPVKRTQAVENHYKWADAAKTLGCLTIRVNADSEGGFEEQQKLAADGLRRLTEYGAQLGLNVIVENHGELSSHGDWLAGVMKLVNHPRCGTLPDFGNFYEYDRYQGVTDMMPYAKAVSAKSYDFDERGEETTIDFHRMMKIVTRAGFHSWVGIEYEGDRLAEREGILKTKALLERIRTELS